ncbi:MAG TPA: hypothetical protein DEF45_04795 [Rhodopirellula sp.]|nr:hypothetical protein [Rhodopirellula sp.]
MNKFLVFISVCCLVHGSSHSYASDGEGVVSSWNDFYEYHKSSNAFGTFQTKGVTQGMWAGIEAGQEYTATYTLESAEGGKTIRASHRMETASGEVISIGVGLQYWDERTKSVLSSYSGYDQGSFFNGFSTVKSFQPLQNLIEWEYTETSHGKVTKYLQTVKQLNKGKKQQVAKKASGGPSWDEQLTRTSIQQRRPDAKPVIQRLLRRVTRE